MKKLTEWQRMVLEEVREANGRGVGFLPANHINGQRRRRYYQTLRALEGRCPSLVEHHQQGGKELGYWIPAPMSPEDVAQCVSTLLKITERTVGFGVVDAVHRENLVALELNTGQVFTFLVGEETRNLKGKWM